MALLLHHHLEDTHCSVIEILFAFVNAIQICIELGEVIHDLGDLVTHHSIRLGEIHGPFCFWPKCYHAEELCFTHLGRLINFFKPAQWGIPDLILHCTSFPFVGYREIGYFEIILDGIVNEGCMLASKQEEFSD
jgi:hypothetical protein